MFNIHVEGTKVQVAYVDEMGEFAPTYVSQVVTDLELAEQIIRLIFEADDDVNGAFVNVQLAKAGICPSWMFPEKATLDMYTKSGVGFVGVKPSMAEVAAAVAEQDGSHKDVMHPYYYSYGGWVYRRAVELNGGSTEVSSSRRGWELIKEAAYEGDWGYEFLVYVQEKMGLAKDYFHSTYKDGRLHISHFRRQDVAVIVTKNGYELAVGYKKSGVPFYAILFEDRTKAFYFPSIQAGDEALIEHTARRRFAELTEE